MYIRKASANGRHQTGNPEMNTGPKKKSGKKSTTFTISDWMNVSSPEAGAENLVLLRERDGARSLIENAFQETVKDHLAGLSIIHRISGYKESLEFIRNKMPRPVRVRSGDCGEILATEY